MKKEIEEILTDDQIYMNAPSTDADLNRIKEKIKNTYYSDPSFEKCTKEEVLTLLRLNLRYRAVPLHTFGLHIKI